jgi:hypothetical protein
MLSYHIPGGERILEIPIYRCTDEQHRDEEDRRFEEWIRLQEEQFFYLGGGRYPDRIKIWEDHRRKAYGRAGALWDFNQIIGWIRLYTGPGHVRGYLFLTKERITKITRRKTFQTRRGSFIQFRVYPNQSNLEILARLKTAIHAAIADHRRLRRCCVDTGVLDVLGPHIDWLGLIRPPIPAPFDPERFRADLTSEQSAS